MATRLVKAAEALMNNGITHTSRPDMTSLPWRSECIAEAANDLISHASHVADSATVAGFRSNAYWDPAGVGVAVSAVQGSCVAFFTRSKKSDGMVDKHSWHGGAAVKQLRPESGKWTLQKFREVPAGGESSIEDYASRHGVLLPGYGGGVCFEICNEYLGPR